MTQNPPKLAYDLDHDVEVLSAMAANLTPYLYEQEMYGYMPGDLPKLTLGGLLMRRYRLSRLEDVLDAKQQNAVQDALLNFEAEISKWAVHYEGKLQHELRMRLDALVQYLKECSEDPLNCAASYPVQAEKRTMIEHLKTEANENNVLSDELDAYLKETDQRFRRMLQTGDFVFDDILQPVYPAEKFWWLYGFIPERPG